MPGKHGRKGYGYDSKKRDEMGHQKKRTAELSYPNPDRMADYTPGGSKRSKGDSHGYKQPAYDYDDMDRYKEGVRVEDVDGEAYGDPEVWRGKRYDFDDLDAYREQGRKQAGDGGDSELEAIRQVGTRAKQAMGGNEKEKTGYLLEIGVYPAGVDVDEAVNDQEEGTFDDEWDPARNRVRR